MRAASTKTQSVIAIARTPAVESVLREAFGSQKSLASELHRSSLSQINGKIFETIDKADILFVDLDPNDEREIATLDQLVSERQGHGAMVATVPEGCSLAQIRKIVRTGVDDVLPQPLGTSDVQDALQLCERRLAERRRPAAGEIDGHVVGFMRGRGGAGTTTLALNTAIALTRKKRRKDPGKRVLLIDLDLQFGDCDLLLDLEPRNSMLEIIRHPERLDQALLMGAVVKHEASGLDVLPSPQDPVPIEAMTGATITHLLELACANYDYVILDMPPALTNWLEPILARLDKLYLLTRLDVPSIRQTRRMMDILAEDLMGLPLDVVLNRYVYRFMQGGKLRQGAKALGRQINHTLPEDTDVARHCVDSGTPVILEKPRSKLGRAITKFTASMVAELIKARERADA